jgi:tRNA1Val (adenine37-N6)-methyltransferase
LEASQGHLLGGAVRYDQPRQGYRTGIEPVLMAAAVQAQPGQAVLEGGTGAGAGLLCLAHRVSGLVGWGVEIMPEMASLATANLDANGYDGLRVSCSDIRREEEEEISRPEWIDALFDHAMANPPWHDDAGTVPAEPLRRAAKMARKGELEAWISALSRRLRPRGSITLILPSAATPAALAALTASNCGGARLLPLWPRSGQTSRIVILQARLDDRSEFRLLPGLVLHRDGDSRYTEAAEAILRGGAGLALD